MSQFTITITVAAKGKSCKLKDVSPPQPVGTPPTAVPPQPGDDIVWTVQGTQGNGWLVIGDFKKKSGAAACPMEQPYYGISPGQGSVLGRVKKAATKGKYGYWVRVRTPAAIGLRAAQHLLPTPTLPDGGAEMPDPRVIMLSEAADSEMNPEIQIGG
jgi:hypothetical protein